MAYRYKESGLDDFVLLDGYTIRQTPYGETVSIQNVEGLHKLIARVLILQQPRVTGAELRFLRSELDKTQAELAELLATSEQTVSLWERARGEAMPETPARLLRLLVADHLGLKPKPASLLRRLAKLAPGRRGTREVHYERGWKPVAA